MRHENTKERRVSHTPRRMWILGLCFLSFVCVSHGATNLSGTNSTILGIKDSHFTLNNRPRFLLGFSYYGALGAPEDFIRKDLTEFRDYGFNWLRVWATWAGFETNVSAVTAEGFPREPFLTRLQWLVAECDRLGLVVDVTLTRGKQLPDFQAHRHVVNTLVTALKPFRNWYLDLGNERDVGDARHVSLGELKELREQVRALDPQRLVTASFGGHDLSAADVRGVLEVAGVDFLCPHRPRDQTSPGQTETETRKTIHAMEQIGRIVPVHYQEPFRRGYTAWEPVAADFLTDLRGALKSRAAGWCFHNGGQRTTRDEQPRRSFDLRAKRLLDQLDEEEMKVVRGAKSVLSDHEKQAGAALIKDASATLMTSFLGTKAGEEHEVAGIKLCWCAAGHFRMGSPPSEPGHRPDEKQVEVTLSQGFWISKYEVTQGEWKRVVGQLPGDVMIGEGDDFPVHSVNYAEAEKFCHALTKRARKKSELPQQWEFRLPTEAQWEYACRAGTTTATSFGDKLSSRQANFEKTPYNGAEEGPSLKKAAKVGSYPPNAWGLHDMHGNMFEWCRDWYHTKLPGGSDPYMSVQGTVNSDGTYSRVRRGGAFTDQGVFCRSAFRLRYEPERRSDHIGFRVVAVRE